MREKGARTLSDPFTTTVVLFVLVTVAVWAVRAEVGHRRDRVTTLLHTVRALAGTDLDAARHLHHQAARAARWLPRDALADTDQWLLDVGPHAAIPPRVAEVEPRHRFVVRARPTPGRDPLTVDPLEHLGTARIPAVLHPIPPPLAGGAGRGRAVRSAGEAGLQPGRGHPTNRRPL